MFITSMSKGKETDKIRTLPASSIFEAKEVCPASIQVSDENCVKKAMAKTLSKVKICS